MKDMKIMKGEEYSDLLDKAEIVVMKRKDSLFQHPNVSDKRV